MKVHKFYSRKVYKGSNVEVTQMGNVTEIKYLSHRNSHCYIRKLNKDEYVNLDTGEVIEVKHSENRGENLHGIRQSIGVLRRIINNNFTGLDNELWITLTFKNQIYNPAELKSYFDSFIKRLRRAYSNKKIDYIYVPEPHEKGGWHIHLLLKADSRIYIPQKELEKIWGNGYVFINRLKDVDNVGAYVSAYLIDIKEGEETKKGARLYLYPPQHKLYRCSKGIKYPESYFTTYEEALKQVQGHQKTFETNTEIEVGAENYKCLYHCEYYNRIHKK